MSNLEQALRVVVTGGRDYNDARRVERALERVAAGIAFLIDGGATGADKWARRWGKAHGIDGRTVHADWNLHGRAAGPIRNSTMLAYRPDVVVAFPGGTGTADMTRKARKRGVAILYGENLLDGAA